MFLKFSSAKSLLLTFLSGCHFNASFLYTFFNSSWLTFFGTPKNPWIQEFFSNKSDYAILIDRSNNYLINHLAIHCKANCYIGYKSIPQNQLLTLQIAPLLENEHETFLRYIKLIEN